MWRVHIKGMHWAALPVVAVVGGVKAQHQPLSKAKALWPLDLACAAVKPKQLPLLVLRNAVQSLEAATSSPLQKLLVVQGFLRCQVDSVQAAADNRLMQRLLPTFAQQVV
jgi:hypothetical protein